MTQPDPVMRRRHRADRATGPIAPPGRSRRPARDLLAAAGRGGVTIRPIALAFLLSAGGAAWAGDTPDFADYPGAAVYHGRNAAPILATREDRQFRTMIRNGARGKPNFDGHYIVWTWGCGTDCEMGVIIDAITGKVVSLPVVAGTPQ